MLNLIGNKECKAWVELNLDVLRKDFIAERSSEFAIFCEERYADVQEHLAHTVGEYHDNQN